MKLVVRHLTRIDDIDFVPEKQIEFRNNTDQLNNPFIFDEKFNDEGLSDVKYEASVEIITINLIKKLSNKITENFNNYTIFSSPFLRCIQTALHIAFKLNITLDNIKIDFNLGEHNDKFLFETPYNPEKIYKQSLKYLNEINKIDVTTFDIINNTYTGNDVELENEYNTRLHTEINSIFNEHSNFIICTHNYALETFNVKSMQYGEVYDLNEIIIKTGGLNIKYYNKYIKYKQKYIKLKNIT